MLHSHREQYLATADSGALQRYLVDTAINSELAENSIQQLPLHDESKYYTTKLINQIGDYSKYINNKLIMGEQISASDMEPSYLKEKFGKKLCFWGGGCDTQSILNNA